MRPISAETTRVAPVAPVASIAKNGTTVDLTWTDPTPAGDPATLGNPTNEIGFRVERSTLVGSGAWGPWASVGGTVANVTSFNDVTANIGTTTYRYRVIAWNATGEGTSNIVSYGPPPTAPSNLAAPKINQNIVTLTWNDNAINETGFQVERSTNGVNWALVGSTAANVRTLTDTAPRRKTIYYYRVRAVNAWGNSAYTPALRIATK